MKPLADFLANPVSEALAWTLLHSLWQGSLVALTLAGLFASLRRAAPQTRYLLACAALAVMIAVPAITFGRLASAAGSTISGAPAAIVAEKEDSAGWSEPAPLDFAPAAPVWIRAPFAAIQPWLVSIWLLGVLLLSLRFLGGWAAVERLRRVKTRPAAPDWQAALNRLAARLRVTRPVRLLQSAAVRVPSALGVFKPAVLLPASALTGLTPRQIETILAHELAHISRHDYLANLLQTTVETLLFYHPAVWWVSRQARIERENCCDDLAVAVTGSARVYARALADLEEIRLGAQTLAPAATGGALWQRISRLLTPAPDRSEAPSRSLAGILTLASLLTMGAAVRFSVPGDELSGSLLAAHSFAADEPADSPAGKSENESRRAAKDTLPAPGANRDALEGEAIADATRFEAIADAVVEAEREGEASEERSDDSKGPIPLDRVIAYRVHGVTPEFVAELSSLGYTRVASDDLVALRVHGIGSGDIRKMNALWGRLPLDRLVAFRIHGVTPEYAAAMKAAGLAKADSDDLLALKVQGVTAEFVKTARAAWPGPLDAGDIVSLKVHGVTPAEAEKWKALGCERPTLEELTSLKIHGVTTDFAERMRASGVRDLDLPAIVALKIHGATPASVEEFRAVGFTALSADELTALKVHGVGPKDVRAYREAGYPDISPEEVVGLKVHSIGPRDLAEMNREGKIPREDVTEDPEKEEEEK